MIVKLLTEHHLEFLSLNGGCTGSSDSTYVKMPHFRKSHAMAQFSLFLVGFNMIKLLATPLQPYLCCKSNNFSSKIGYLPLVFLKVISKSGNKLM